MGKGERRAPTVSIFILFPAGEEDEYAGPSLGAGRIKKEWTQGSKCYKRVRTGESQAGGEPSARWNQKAFVEEGPAKRGGEG